MTTISIPHIELNRATVIAPGKNVPEYRTPGEGDCKSLLRQSVVPPSINKELFPSGQSTRRILPPPSAPLGVATISPQVSRRNNNSREASSKSELAIESLVETLLNRFPLSSPVIILFVGAQGNPLTGSTCANVAKKLAELRIGEILLVDSSAGRELSRSHQEGDSQGLSNLLGREENWKSLVRTLPTSNLDFLPAGTSHWEHWGAEEKLRTIAAAMKRHYQFVCVAADDANVPNSKIWTGICDGSFLLVSLKNANQAVAESAVVELQTSGARLLGCIVTETDSHVV